jgi:ABC transport system ATP-binding/permease protein
MEIGRLSGGERARIAIAHLMLQPADLLLLDEPTNDLDIPRLETLEESLLEFPGAVVLITHDRCMVDRICNSLLALGDSEQPTFFADYHQWQNTAKNLKTQKASKEKKTETAPLTPSTKKKLSYHEKREYEGIESAIHSKEEELKQLNREITELSANPNHEILQNLYTKVAILETQIEKLYLRWEELENRVIVDSI